MKASFILFGFGHGIVEACINPLCATLYKEQKSKMLNILHASWPAGVALGATAFLCLGGDEGLGWRSMFWLVLLPVVSFGGLFLFCRRYPQDERVEAKVSYVEMLREFGGLGVFLAVSFMVYEAAVQLGAWPSGYERILSSLAIGAVAGLVSGWWLRSAGQWLFFLLCLIMIPLATAELATDGWIRELMKPVLATSYQVDSGWAIVLSSLIMMSLRFFAGVPLRFMSPPALLLFSSIFSILGLFLLASAEGAMIFVAFVLYGVGQTFYWPTVLGFTAEQFPKGGAMTLNTVSAMGLLTVGIFGFPFLGAVGDHYDAQLVREENPALYQKHQSEENFFAWSYEKVDLPALKEASGFPTAGGELTVDQAAFEERLSQNKRKVLRVAAALPAVMALAFGLICLAYRMRGGYRPVRLVADGPEEAAEERVLKAGWE